jgi:subtilisin family serine protease
MNEKIENELNLALNATPEELNKSRELSVGFDAATDLWELIVRYSGKLKEIYEISGITIKELLNGYAILNVPKNQVDKVATLSEIIFVEKPKRLEYAILNAKRESCINQVQQSDFFGAENGLFGEGVIVGIADSGIDYTNMVFRNQDGTTRILKLWDQVTGIIYDETQINEALKNENPYAIVNSKDLTGHGTHVAGIAAGNFAIDKNNNLGIATKSKIIFVKMATATENSFPRTTQLMEAVDFIVRQAGNYNMPLSLNLSFGNTYGSHDGTSLLSTYLDSVIDGRQISVQIGAGNEGDSAGHAGGFVNMGQNAEIEFQVSGFQKSFSIQLWKDYVDEFGIEIISPSGAATPVIREKSTISRHNLENTELFLLYGTPKPFSRYQEIYMDFIPANQYIDTGIWTIRIIPYRVVVGRYDLWLPNSQSLNENTKFLKPDPLTTLTIPGATLKAVTVGAYDSSTGKAATFSGRGFLRENNQVKPDIVAPGVNISSAAVGGGSSVQSGTSMATPFVSGSVALMMEWGIVRGNDSFLYGEKVKAYLIKGARHLTGFTQYPNPEVGWGALCLRDSFEL